MIREVHTALVSPSLPMRVPRRKGKVRRTLNALGRIGERGIEKRATARTSGWSDTDRPFKSFGHAFLADRSTVASPITCRQPRIRSRRMYLGSSRCFVQSPSAASGWRIQPVANPKKTLLNSGDVVGSADGFPSILLAGFSWLGEDRAGNSIRTPKPKRQTHKFSKIRGFLDLRKPYLAWHCRVLKSLIYRYRHPARQTASPTMHGQSRYVGRAARHCNHKAAYVARCSQILY